VRNLQVRLISFLVVLLTGASLPAQAQTAVPTAVAPQSDAPDYAKQGLFLVGTQEFVIPDQDGKRPLPFTIWYPALAPEEPAEATAEATRASSGRETVPRALIDAVPALTESPYPLLIITHGLGGQRSAYTHLAVHLASYGFVVAAAEHDDSGFDLTVPIVPVDDQITTLLLYDRPHDIMREIAYADTLTATNGTLAGLIDTEHIAILGHSTGGTTTFQAGGARVDFTALEAWCNDQGINGFTRETCQFVGHGDALATRYGVDKPQDGLFPPLWDNRVDAIVAMAPGGELHAFGDDGIAAVQVPTLILVGTADEYVSPEYNAYWAYDHISSQNKTLASFNGGSHMMFLSCCGYDAAKGGPRFEDLKAHLTTAFLLDILKGDQTAHNALLPEAVMFADVEYKTTIQ
jgi:predicted dienelactone hydrolase